MQQPTSPVTRRVAVIGATVALLALVLGLASSWPALTQPSNFSALDDRVRSHEVASLVIDGEHVVAQLTTGETLEAVVASEAAREALVERAMAAEVSVEFAASTLSPPMRRAAGAVVLLALVVAAGVGLRRFKRKRHNFFEKQSPREDGTSFEDVAGLESAKQALIETVAFLRKPERFAKLGARHPRGILLTGEPGTGKTMLARAVANEAGVAFLSCSGSSFQEMFVGVGASRIRSLFEEAKRLAPCIVFIDEIDAVGRSRGNSADPSSGEHDRTLNQLLVALDGFEEATGVVVMATTNRPDVLDKALVRPGRFDRTIMVPVPCQSEPLAILEVHARRFALSDDVDLEALSRGMVGASGADLANVLNEAALIAARTGLERVGPKQIDEARDAVLMGEERPGLRMAEDERYATAVHESGHAVVAMTAPECDDVHKVSILPRGRALGVTQCLPKERVMHRREYLEDQICMLLGGRAAELEILNTATAGAQDDLRRASTLARQMVAELGMGRTGCLHIATEDAARWQVDRVESEAAELLNEQLDRARQIVRARRDSVDALVGALMDREMVDDEGLSSLMPRQPSPSKGRQAVA